MLCLSRIWVFAAYLQNTPPFAKLTSGYGSPLRLVHFWSLAVEEQFYLVWPFLILRMKNIREAKSLCLTVFLVSFVFRIMIWTCLSDPMVFLQFILARAGELAAGGYLAFCFRDVSWKKHSQFASVIFLTSLVASLTIFAKSGSFQLRSSAAVIYGLPCITLFWASFLVLSLQEGGLVNRAMNMRWLRWLGGISYGVYIFHELLHPVYQKLALLLLHGANRNELLLLGALITIVLSLLIAWLSFRFFESRFLKLRSKFSSISKVTVSA